MKFLFPSIVTLLFAWGCNKSSSDPSAGVAIDKGTQANVEANGRKALDPSLTERQPDLKTPDELKNHLVQNPAILDAPGVHIQFAKIPGALEDKEIIDRVRERFFTQRQNGQYYGDTALILRLAKDKQIAAPLLEDIKKLNAFDFTGLDQSQIANLLPQNRKYLWLNTLVDIGEPTSMTGMWQHFDEGGAQTQRTIARAVSSSGDLAQANECIAHMESAKDESARQDLQYAASCIVTNALSQQDNRRALELAKELQKAGLARDFLIEKLEKIEKPAE